MTAAFGAAVAVCVALTGADVPEGILFCVTAALISKFKPIRCWGRYTVPILLLACAVALNTPSAIAVILCCAVTSFVKKNYLFCLPLLLTASFLISFFSMGRSAEPTATLFLLPLLVPCAASVAPRDIIKGLCVGIGVLLPVAFGGARIAAVCILLPPLLPVLLQAGKRIQSFKEE